MSTHPRAPHRADDEPTADTAAAEVPVTEPLSTEPPSTGPRAGEPGAGEDAAPSAADTDEPPPPRRRVAVRTVALLVTGLLGLAAALLVPFAPVMDRDTTVTWPRAGDAAASTTAFFVPYAPESMRVTVPCPVVRAGLGRDGPATVLATDMPGADTTGLTVSTADGRLIVLVGGRQVYREPVPEGDACGLVLDTSGTGSVLRQGDAAPQRFPGDRVRSVRAFTTDLPPADTAGLRVVARTADWFAVSPTGTKDGLVVVALLLAAASLALLAVADRRALRGVGRLWRARAVAAVSLRGWARRAVDAAVLAVLAAWTVLGPLTTDDGFTEGIVRNAAGTDAFVNYYRWENASEAPFTLVLRLVQPLVDAGADPLLLRVPSLVAGVLVWLLLSRVALPVLLPGRSRRTWVRALLAVSLLAWWMPFDVGVRPEPFAAVAVTAVLAFALRAAYRPGRAGHTMLGLAALSFGIALAVTPSAVAAAGPLLVVAPRLWRLLRDGVGGSAGWLRAVAGLAAAAALAGVGLVVMFTGQSWYSVSRATEMHAFYGPNVPWFQEIMRYDYLLGFDGEQGSMARRLPVLVTIALLVAAVPMIARGVHRMPGLARVPVPVLGLAAGLLLFWLTPSKWTHYFGTVAGLGAAALTAGVVLVAVAARERAGDPAVRASAAAGTVALVVAAAVAFSGRNTAFLYSRFGVPREDGPFRPLNTPLPWLLLVVVLLAVAALPVLGGRAGAARMLARMPAVLAAVVTVTTVAVLLVTFAQAPGRQAGSYSVGGQMLAHLRGEDTCGILDHVVTTEDTPGGVLAPDGNAAGAEDLVGFTRDGGYRGTPPSPPGRGASTFLWGSSDRGALSTGTMTSEWFALPRLRADQELALDVSGRTAQGNRLALEFARPGDGDPAPLGQRVLDDTDTSPESRAEYPSDRVDEDTPLYRPQWRTVYLGPSAVPDGATLVRVRAADATTDAGGFLAVTGPRLRDVEPVRASLRGSGPVFVDWSLLWSAPCVRNAARVAGGVAQAPGLLLEAPADLGFSGDASFVPGIGGSFAPMATLDRESVLTTRLEGTRSRPGYADWGSVVRVTYPVARDAYDTDSTTVRRWGWEGDRTPLGYPELPAP